LALLCSGILVAALVTIWVQVIRTTTASSLESARQVQRQTLQRKLARLVSSLQWTPSSHLPQGVMPWGHTNTSSMFWSRESFGASPGPVRWTIRVQDAAWVGQWEDPSPASEAVRQGTLLLDGVAELHVETLKEEVDTQGEQVRWTELRAWDPAQPFRPLGFRFRIKWKEGEDDTYLFGPP
jgi:hypothetical protein